MTLDRPSVDEILRAVCRHTGVPVAQLTTEGKVSAACAARAVAAYAMRHLRNMSFPEIAQVLGYSSHSSVIHIVKDQAKREGIARTSHRILELLIATRK